MFACKLLGVQRDLPIPLPAVDRRKTRRRFFCGEISGSGQNLLPSTDTGETLFPSGCEDVGGIFWIRCRKSHCCTAISLADATEGNKQDDIITMINTETQLNQKVQI